MMEYKGYIGVVEFDDKAKIFHGDIINIRDVITFQGTSVEEIEKAFQDSINDYLEWCEKDGINPEKPYSGKFNLRLSPELHKEVAITAKKLKISINSFVEKALQNEINIYHVM
ncbi:MAG: antitoxin HicB [Spirochaetes bacterium GWF1_31_7]|nr:MAG: antitoxin HicB [Spirochaetes bacterium GWE1_32_154]OHD46160.1 MAG: antitoxin HicB [Spirochaetes bacterium GWE2_31_10]OHD49902.1 MAG: antitoxin HicB [Spirochaetes bacterium GWF1_31_7]OHD75967.1 MAG: antitoxin HicB [Spirochaetes bacterium RIFOXYB1_FULL_32_8]HBI37724.1 toxin-antitoxin system HicB family antitoxin [Spirochaetia bacterium]